MSRGFFAYFQTIDADTNKRLVSRIRTLCIACFPRVHEILGGNGLVHNVNGSIDENDRSRSGLHTCVSIT